MRRKDREITDPARIAEILQRCPAASFAFAGGEPYVVPMSFGFEERDGRLMMPLSITCHHAAADGWHVQGFLEAWQTAADGIGNFCAL